MFFSFRYLVSTFCIFIGILVSQAKKMVYIGIPLPPAGPEEFRLIEL